MMATSFIPLPPLPMANILCFLIATSTFAAIVAEFGNVAPPVVYHQLDK